MPVDRCVCHQISFVSLLPIVESLRDQGIHKDTAILDRLRKQSICSNGCTLCEPYILRMIQSGQTRFDPLPSEHE